MADSLYRSGRRQALAPMIEALRDPDELLRATSAAALADRDDAFVVQALVKALPDLPFRTRRHMVSIAREKGNWLLLAELINHDGSSDVRRRALWAWAESHRKASHGFNSEQIAFLDAVAGADPERLVRGEAISMLGEVRTAPAVAALQRIAASEPCHLLRRAALEGVQASSSQVPHATTAKDQAPQ